ncbi:hypothetical protein CSUI_008368 [Cystoisospora suis]|uniref:Uncharacterized protein n=1 Tax=Cystoisospora suis TaxID=483139 RepID=A0A2C6KMV3_9APIC|nr:hypothetical protein CSUI_008368 [Cystoisospora suis]
MSAEAGFSGAHVYRSSSDVRIQGCRSIRAQIGQTSLLWRMPSSLELGGQEKFCGLIVRSR